MKDRKNEYLRRLAIKLAELEKQLKAAEKDSSKEKDLKKRVSNVVSSLDPDELFFIDEYIYKKKLLN